MWTSRLNYCFYCRYFLEHNKCKPLWYSCHWIPLHHIVFDSTKFLEIIVYVLLSRTSNTTYEYFSCLNIFRWILLSSWTVRLWLRCCAVVWHLLFSCEWKLALAHAGLAIWIVLLLTIRVLISSITLSSITLLIWILRLLLVLLAVLSVSSLLSILLLLPIILSLPIWVTLTLSLVSMLAICCPWFKVQRIKAHWAQYDYRSEIYFSYHRWDFTWCIK